MIPKMALILNIGGYTCVGVGRRDTGTLVQAQDGGDDLNDKI